MKSIPSDKLDNVISLLGKGKSSRVIQSRTGVGKSKVAQIAQEVYPDKENLKGGRPTKLSAADQRAISLDIQPGKAANAVEATQHINSTLSEPVSTQTVRNLLKDDGFQAVVKKKKPFLSKQHREARLKFAQKYRNGTVEDWKRVIWSDETKINRSGSDGRHYVWKKKGEPLQVPNLLGYLLFTLHFL